MTADEQVGLGVLQLQEREELFKIRLARFSSRKRLIDADAESPRVIV
ncbi:MULTISPECIES: hypothetical protein [unclassified Mycobacteroides]|nr:MULTISPECIES: hypothetical protein [unclassified Mycobacteroides]